MRSLLRYARAWSTLPPDERRARAGRVVDRWLRRDPRVRGLALAPEPPSWARFARALSVPAAGLAARLRRPDGSRHPLHVDLGPRAAAAARTRRERAESVLGEAVRLLDRRFDLLGSGPVRPLRPDGGIDWHRDFKSGVAWDPDAYFVDVVTVRGDGSDVKVPWELSRFQHLLVLGEAYHLAPIVAGVGASALQRRVAEETVAQIDDWISANPRGIGVNWSCTMDVAIRAANWTAALALLRSAPEITDAFWMRAARSLWSHGRHIRANLEIGPDGLTTNHYLADVVGLLSIACFLPELRESASWRAFGLAALEEEMEKQVHEDGVDFERSIPYHRLATELFLNGALLAAGSGATLGEPFRARLAAMLEFVATYTRPDGSAPQWGDNDDGRYLPLDGYASPKPHDHRHVLVTGGRLLQRPDLQSAGGTADWEALWLLPESSAQASVAPSASASRAFPKAASFALRTQDVHVYVPCGPVGTRGLGNHSHNDLLSFSLWACGREWITDPGTGAYTGDPALRNRLRATSAHATLQIDDREQNRFAPGIEDLFALHASARPEVVAWRSDAEATCLVARHSGYSAGGSTITHRRGFLLVSGTRRCVVVDRVEVSGADRSFVVHLRLPLPPDVRARLLAPGEPLPAGLETETIHPSDPDLPVLDDGLRAEVVSLGDGSGRAAFLRFDVPRSARVSIVDAPYSPRYGVVLASTALHVAWLASDGLTARTVFQGVPREDRS